MSLFLSHGGNNNEMYPPHLLAKNLNNRASTLIESGKYKEGVVLLTRALKLTKQDMIEHDTRTPCSCESCRFEAVLPSTEQQQQQQHLRDLNTSGHCSCRRQKQQQQQQQQQLLKREHPRGEDGAIEKGGNEEGFVYRRPLFVNRNSIEENHFMGATLVWMLLFNLALAHHLMYLEGGLVDGDGGGKEKCFRKAVKLYEIAYQSHLDHSHQEEQQQQRASDDDDDNIHYDGALSATTTSGRNDDDNDDCDCDNNDYSSLRFAVIVSNNVGQIHRVAGNARESERCLRHLLRVIMYVVECELVGRVLGPTELDGLCGNVIPIVLGDVCAPAA